MRRFGNGFFILFLLFLAGFWLLRSGDVHAATEYAVRLCVFSLLPALFPFFILTDLLISLGFPAVIGRVLRRPMEQLYRIGGSGSSALVLGFLGGYPTGARTVASLYMSGELSRDEAERLPAFSNNGSPAFLIGFVGGEVFHDTGIGLCLWLIHVASALLTGLLFRGRGALRRRALPPQKQEPLPGLLLHAVSTALSSFLSVCSVVLLFSVLSFPLQGCGFLSCLLELTGGLSRLPASPLGFAAAGFFCGFGGLAVQLQSLAFLLPAGLSPRNLLLGKLCHGLLAGLLSLLITPLLFP